MKLNLSFVFVSILREKKTIYNQFQIKIQIYDVFNNKNFGEQKVVSSFFFYIILYCCVYGYKLVEKENKARTN